jgi:hypothetical protein
VTIEEAQLGENEWVVPQVGIEVWVITIADSMRHDWVVD